jgi:hypothetical protein
MIVVGTIGINHAERLIRARSINIVYLLVAKGVVFTDEVPAVVGVVDRGSIDLTAYHTAACIVGHIHRV